MAETSKELLNQPTKPSILETLFLANKDPVSKAQQAEHPAARNLEGRPLTTTIPQSQFLGKVKDFLGVMAKANEELELNAQGKSHSKYDIEVLSGNEQGYIEMDLLLGVADLHGADAVAAAEASVGGFQPSTTSATSSFSDTGDDSDEDNGSGNDTVTCLPEKPDSDKDRSLHDDKLNDKPNKRPKIVVLN